MAHTALVAASLAAALFAAGPAWAQTGPIGTGAAGTAQSQGVTAGGGGGIATPRTTPGVGPAPGAPTIGSGSGASTGEGLSTTGGLAGAGGPATGAAAQGTKDPRTAPAAKP